MKINGGASNLINGVSRQTPDVRLTTQLEESVNQWPTITRGLVPRNPAIRLGALPALRSGTLIHLIDRDASERYVAEIGNGSIRVWDLEGNQRTVNAPNGFGYVSDEGEDNFQAVTIADHTFILNKNRTVQKGAARTAATRQHALVHIVQASYHTGYTIRINGNTVARLVTGGGPHDDDTWARTAERVTRTDFIASGLFNGRTPQGGAALPTEESLMRVDATLFDGPTTTGNLDPVEWGVTLYGNVLHIVNKLGNDFEIEAFADDPNLVRAHKDTAPVYSDLPKRAPHGFSLKINGDESSDHDDYYVVFDKGAGAAEGRWKETHAPDTQFRLSAGTMPHLLVRETDGSFTFKPAEWVQRRVGDDETNPWPSFVGKKVSGLIYAQNRLGLFSGESIALSVHNSYFDFFKESLLARLDTDPVDLTIAHPEVSNILHGVPMGDEIVLFTTSVQFRLSSNGERLTPDNGDIKPILSSKARSRSTPISLGTRLYFANDAKSGSFVHEFTYDRESGVKAEEDISSHVQGYLPGTVDYLCGDQELRTLVLASRGLPRQLFVYRWMHLGGDRVQSAWQRWIINSVTAIKAISVFDEDLILVAAVSDGAEVLSINLHEGWKQGAASPLYADRQVRVSGSYSPITDETTFTVPYGGATVVLNPTESGFGQVLHAEWSSPTEFSLSGDWTGEEVVVGFSYESYGVLSPLLYRTTNNQGAYGNAVPGVDTWISNVNFGSGNTAFLEVTVTRRYRPPYRIVLTPAQVTTETGWLGPQQRGKATGTVSVMAKSEDVQIRFGSTGSQPYEITGLSWSGNATPTTL